MHFLVYILGSLLYNNLVRKPLPIMTDKEKAEKELKKFKNEFDKLMSKYPHVMVSSDINGYLMAYHTVAYNSKICIN